MSWKHDKLEKSVGFKQDTASPYYICLLLPLYIPKAELHYVIMILFFFFYNIFL